MKDYKVISIDMFQTLVDVNTRTEHIWRRILKNNYTEKLRDNYVNEVSACIVDKFHSINCKSEFKTLKELFSEGFEEIFEKNLVQLDHVLATEIFIDEHNKASIYEDSIEFLDRAREKYKLCLASDADIEMIEKLLNVFQFDNLFISENIKAYKGDSNSRIFESILEFYKIKPQDMLHIGDSSSDINGAGRLGIDTCWINRDRSKRTFEIQPNFEIYELRDLYNILDI